MGLVSADTDGFRHSFVHDEEGEVIRLEGKDCAVVFRWVGEDADQPGETSIHIPMIGGDRDSGCPSVSSENFLKLAMTVTAFGVEAERQGITMKLAVLTLKNLVGEEALKGMEIDILKRE